ncbi:MAG: 50S ribosomal protein L10, partial [Defluviicoccus sp.]|nr:50S ribosomal protein L10 [Defluviicoccus sp.]
LVVEAVGVPGVAWLPWLDLFIVWWVGFIPPRATGGAGVLQAPAGQLARLMGAYADKDAA